MLTGCLRRLGRLASKLTFARFAKSARGYQTELRASRLERFQPNDPQLEAMSDEGYALVAMMAANRVGKTLGAASKTAYHLTGMYPDWFPGHRFKSGTSCWAAGVTAESTRDIIQQVLLGKLNVDTGADAWGNGLIPRDRILRHTLKAGVKDAIDEVFIRHVSGDTSYLGFKTIQQGPAKFQGTAKHHIWLDEEPDDKHEQMIDILMECVTRNMTIPGASTLITYTPCHGMTPMCSLLLGDYRPEGRDGAVFDVAMKVVNASWEDVTHLGAAEKEKLRALYSMAGDLESRSQGIPTLKEGLVYPFSLKEITCDPFPIPKHFLTVIGADVAKSGTWGGTRHFTDPATDIDYVVDDYKKANISRDEYAMAILKWGEGVYVAVDPSANQTEIDGTKTMRELRRLGLNAYNAKNQVGGHAGGIQTVFDRFAADRLKIFKTCRELIREIQFYHWKNNKIVKRNDHCVDPMRYAVMARENARPLSYWKKTRSKTRVRPGWRPADAFVGY